MQRRSCLFAWLLLVTLSSESAAIHLALIQLGVQAGDEVICQSITCVDAVNPVVYLGAKPVFVITTSEGGALICRTEEQAQRTKFYATQACDPAPHNQHSHIGYNYRMNNISMVRLRSQTLRQSSVTAAGSITLFAPE